MDVEKHGCLARELGAEAEHQARLLCEELRVCCGVAHGSRHVGTRQDLRCRAFVVHRLESEGGSSPGVAALRFPQLRWWVGCGRFQRPDGGGRQQVQE
ncbi:hypothetical protein [Saccharopolyspora spinosa]|uniref:hypothetical protein n=1 Tax=Saccharopolyspora spinosa TaxID=60894 RepID=UPI00376F3ECA